MAATACLSRKHEQKVPIATLPVRMMAPVYIGGPIATTAKAPQITPVSVADDWYVVYH
jgi:hypothetical protein